jgi:hypothetical protein
MWHAWERRKKCIRCWWESPNEKDHSGGPRHRWEDGIRMDLGVNGCGGLQWIQLAQDMGQWGLS